MGTRRVFGSITAGSNGAVCNGPPADRSQPSGPRCANSRGLWTAWLSTSLSPSASPGSACCLTETITCQLPRPKGRSLSLPNSPSASFDDPVFCRRLLQMWCNIVGGLTTTRPCGACPHSFCHSYFFSKVGRHRSAACIFYTEKRYFCNPVDTVVNVPGGVPLSTVVSRSNYTRKEGNGVPSRPKTPGFPRRDI